MAGFRIPGPTCSARFPWSIDDGTNALWPSPPPGPICASSRTYPSSDIDKASTPDNDPIVDFLFTQCLNPVQGLSGVDYEIAATSLGVEEAAIKAVSEVETAGHAFDEYGRPKILFERHYFHKLTTGKFDLQNPNISNKKQGGYGKFSIQYHRLKTAYDIDEEAALRSASWGRFQIMGDNFKAAGFSSVKKFVSAMSRSESEQLKAFVNFVKTNKSMLSALKKKDWEKFASLYNGKKYKDNKYDEKLNSAYLKFSSPSKVPIKKP